MATGSAVADATVDDLLNAVRATNTNGDRAILGVTCDGIDVLGDELDSVLASPASQFKRIDVETGDPASLVRSSLETAADSLDIAQDRQVQIIEFLGEGKTVEAMRLLSECIGQWLRINDVIGQSISLLSRNIPGLRDEADALSAMLEPVRDKLKEIRDAVAGRDFVLLSDILEYEFPKVTICWLDAINGIRRHLAPDQSGSV